jgi:hypothetical protein
VTRKQRLEAAIAGERPDRTPLLGGWIAAPSLIMEITGRPAEEYWADPVGVSIEAYDQLGMDGLIGVFVPRHQDDFRCIDGESYMKADKGLTLEEAVAAIDDMPSAEEVEASFDFEAAYQTFRDELIEGQRRAGDMLWMPAQWLAAPHVTWYAELGYEAFLMVIGLHEDRGAKLMEIGGARGRNQCRLVARAVEEGLYPRAVLLGEDICTQRGPMVSPDFLEEHYLPALVHGFEPLLKVGCKPIWHCDGDVRPLLPMLIESGVQGLQGFQPECGMDIDSMARLRTRDGEKLVLFGPLSVTTELPVCTPEEIRAKTRHAIEVCRDQAHLVLFTANTINPDIPLENLRAMYDEARREERGADG